MDSSILSVVALNGIVEGMLVAIVPEMTASFRDNARLQTVLFDALCHVSG